MPPAPRLLTPQVPDDNALFLRGIRLLASLRERDGTELAFGTNEETDGASDPIPKSSVQGRDLLNAAQGRLCLPHQGRWSGDPAQAGKGPLPPRSAPHSSTPPRWRKSRGSSA